jgi:excinuclease UvrABC ATPase subunit
MDKLLSAEDKLAETDGGFVRVRGAREHNLKDVSLEIPRNALVVFTGVSGSGKSSLAFGTLYAEAQRRYLASVSPYARRLFHQMAVPDVDSVEGLPPAVALQQQRQKQRHAVIDPLVNPENPPRRHQTRSKADPACKSSHGHTGAEHTKRSLSAPISKKHNCNARLLECTVKGDVSVEGLRAVGRCALEEARAT